MTENAAGLSFSHPAMSTSAGLVWLGSLLRPQPLMSSLIEVGFSENIDRDHLFFMNAPEEAWCEVERRSQD